MGINTAVVETTREPIELIREAFDKLTLRDPEALCDYWAEDIVEQFPTGTYRGRDEVRDYFASLFAAFPDFQIDAVKIAGTGNTVFVRWHASGTFTGASWMGVEATGSRVELDGTDCFTVRDGKIAANFVIFDQISFARQIGLLPAEDSALDRMMRSNFNLRTRLRKRLRPKSK